MDEKERAASTARRTLALAHGVLSAAEDIRGDLERALAETLRALARGEPSPELMQLVTRLREMLLRISHEPAAPMLVAV
jgi:hypothetical protein